MIPNFISRHVAGWGTGGKPVFGHRKSKPRRGTIAEVVSRSLEIPVDVAGGLAQVELLGNREAAIEHCQNVLEYNDDVIRLNTGKLILKFTGRGLSLKCMSGDRVTVTGFFTSIEFSQ
ncbi:hypothetical protein B5F10_07940 [Anaerotruncus colihominis]|jgi:sporulation protein YqfC|uniref:Sporulation protein YqfC n=2 Tax=Anaerotruncus colihominis TaxID=169435 RepID=B0PF58_9FIRM|nr:YabP/YqfC family sporulation protein [Anaerotruncus colihominis]EDS09991.1 putative sporulation protein YqfC [Anaerotruncus colihominis DSM 17241]OUO67488.1 hypothetical protein B5F55_08335 [Anaerotruncus colihominis]OUP69664.1 hypothetical protein B5F11_08465 [Anaerotruncus colihominis]OUP74240.1 hypothetical protein B5F10_07940 [Anaerotruncus colihominis]RGE67688.1 hypothetical protein DXC40_09350 [Anaerotruncus colihominis]